SSESSSNTAWRQNFTDGIQHYSNKTYKFRVRAVRTFPTQNLAPVAYYATVSGVLEVGGALTGSYTYADFENDPEGTSTIQWYHADDATGTNQSAISGATAETYELASADAGKYISFEVTPVAATGTSPGTPTMTDYDGPVFSCGQSFVDIRDDKSYTTVGIGTQCWMAENLAYLPAVVPSATGSETNPYYYVYGYQGTNVAEAKAAANFQTYGVLYNWPASSTACPDGWHLPSDAEWITLEESLGMCTGTGVGCSGATAWRGTDQGSQIAGNAGLWANGGLDQNPSFGSSGFNALPGGRRWTDLTFDRLTTYAFIWTSSDDLTNAWRRALSSNYSMIGRDSNDKSSGFSVRCVRDYYTIGSGNACENTVVNGDYNTTFALTEYEYVSLDVDVTNTGVWSISTNTVNGYSFSGSGTFTSTGTQSVTLAGSGTPLAIQTDQFTATADQNGGSCTFSVDVVAWSCGDHITDSRDGNVYETVQIGDQCWMAENLNYDQSAYGNDYCYDNETSNCDIYGRLYDWDAIMQGAASSSNNPSGVKGVCPDGWHLPSDAEWTELTDYVSSQPEYLCNSNTSYIAKALAATSGWNPSTNTCAVGNDLEANNATGFAALPGGYYYSGSYLSLGSFGNWWSCTQYPSTKAWSRPMYYYNGSVIRVFNNEARGFSVRCLRD
ncbi:MAG: hypothetical protein K9H16_09510, partial [Bacteroidales bacterium]|nr:hypothetical protein [Bacteroidales bacterium]